MPNTEVAKLRGLLHIGKTIQPLITPPEDSGLSHEQFIKKVVWNMNQNDGFGMVELFKEPLLLSPNSTSLLPTAYELESARPANSILPAVNPDHG